MPGGGARGRDRYRGGKGVTRSAAMSAMEAITVLHAARKARDVVVTTMTPARDWMTLPQQPLDLVFVPSAMGHATSIGLGLALAQPDRRVIVANGDGSMLMNLGSLVTIAASGARNLAIVLFDNGVYEVTGSQPTPGAGAVDFPAIARGAGFPSVFDIDKIEDWRFACERILTAPGPVFAGLRVDH